MTYPFDEDRVCLRALWPATAGGRPRRGCRERKPQPRGRGVHLMVRSARSQSAGCGSVLSNPVLDCKSRAPKSATDNVDIHWQEQAGTV